MGPPQARLPLPKIKVFAENLSAAYIPAMPPRSTSEACAHLIVLNPWGERLCGCVYCDQWVSLDGAWRRLTEEDIAAL
jgi:hypothetical protein